MTEVTILVVRPFSDEVFVPLLGAGGLLMGIPHRGHAGAWSEISFPHSEHLINMRLTPLCFQKTPTVRSLPQSSHSPDIGHRTTGGLAIRPTLALHVAHRTSVNPRFRRKCRIEPLAREPDDRSTCLASPTMRRLSGPPIWVTSGRIGLDEGFIAGRYHAHSPDYPLSMRDLLERYWGQPGPAGPVPEVREGV